MFVYAHRVFNAAKTGTAVRDVKCEKCGSEYRYRLFRRGTGTGTSPYHLNNKGAQKRAEVAAAKKLQKLLLYGVDPVACPDCGWLQAEMVAEMQKRSHRWLIPLAIVLGILLALVSFIFWMAATHDFKRELNSSDTVVLIILVAAMVVSSVGPFVLRWLLLKRKNPNRNYPQRPDPIPGAPKPFRPGEEGVLDAIPGDAAADDGLTYQRLPPEVEPGGWVTVQMALWPIPATCCSCLRPAGQVKQFTATQNVKLPVRVRPECTSRYRMRYAGWIIAGVVVFAIGGYVSTLTQRRVDPETPWILAVVGGFIGALFGWLFASNLAPPVRFGRFNSKLNTVRVRFINGNYMSIFMSEEPPAAPTVCSPMLDIQTPPPARPWGG